MVQIVDVSPLAASRAGVEDQASATPGLLAALRSAFEETGFAVVTGHGVSPRTIAEADSAARAFFALPTSAKLDIAPRRWNPRSANRYRGYFPSSAQGKEGLDLGDPNITEADHALLARPYYELNRLPKEFDLASRDALECYFDALSSFGIELATAMVHALGGDPAELRHALARPSSQSTLRLNGYPRDARPVEISKEDGQALACETHVDSGFVTILYQDERGGLQVRDRNRNWLDVPFRPDAFVVNLGRAGEALTGGRFRATAHRVRHQDRERVSIPFFLEPRYDFPIHARSIGLAGSDETAPPSYESFLSDTLAVFEEYAGR